MNDSLKMMNTHLNIPRVGQSNAPQFVSQQIAEVTNQRQQLTFPNTAMDNINCTGSNLQHQQQFIVGMNNGEKQTNPLITENRFDKTDSRVSTVSSVSSALSMSTNGNDVLTKKLMDACNRVSGCDIENAEDECFATMILVQKCVKELIWPKYKFLTMNGAKMMNLQGATVPDNLFGMLLKYTSKSNYNIVQRVNFWNRYSNEVRKILNDLKANATKSIRDSVMKGVQHWVSIKIQCH